MRDFLTAIWGDTDGFGELRPMHRDWATPKQRFFRVANELDEAVEEAIGFDRDGADVYFGVLPRTQRIGRSEVILNETRVLWSDLDGKAFTDAKHGAFLAITRLAPLPQIIIDSGNGYHAYWLLDDVVDFDRAQLVMKGIALSSGADRNALDKARILRVPGTHNHKQEPGIPVRLMRFDMMGRRHRFADFVDYAELAATQDRPRRKTAIAEGVEGWEPSGEDAPKFPDGERNNSLARLAGIMIARGLDDDQMYVQLMHENEMRCDPPLPEREVANIARSVARYRQ